MIEATEHDFEIVRSKAEVRAALDARGGIDGWTLSAAVQDRDGSLALFWTRTIPASPNLGTDT